jgi:hypothetical protein
MASHWSFGHLQPKLWAKERPEVKLAIWFPTTKSRESTSFRHPNLECNMALESSRRELQVWFRPHPDRRSGWEAMMSPKSRESKTGTISGLHFGSPGKKCHLDASATKRHREYYKGGWWWHLPSPGNGVSCESELARGLS